MKTLMSQGLKALVGVNRVKVTTEIHQVRIHSMIQIMQIQTNGSLSAIAIGSDKLLTKLETSHLKELKLSANCPKLGESNNSLDVINLWK